MPERRLHDSADIGPGQSPAQVVWPTGGVDRSTQLMAGGYRPGTAADITGIPPAVAAYAVRTYTAPGDMVLDPDCGAGTVVVEAVRAGRHAVGMASGRWWPVARGNLNAAKLAGALSDGMILQRPCSLTGQHRTGQHRTGQQAERRRGKLSGGTAAGLTGRVELLLTRARLDHGPDRTGNRPAGPSGGDQSKADRLQVAVDRLAADLVRSRPLLRPGGYVIVAAPSIPRDEQSITPSIAPSATTGAAALGDQIAGAAARAALILIERCSAPTALRRRPDRRARRRTARSRHPVTADLDLYVFQVPPSLDAPVPAALPAPPPEAVPRSALGLDQQASGPVAGRGRWAA